MTNLTDRIYAQFTDEQLESYQSAVAEALSRGVPKQMVYQYFLQAAYATLEELGPETGLNNDQLNQTAVEIAHKLYMRATQNDGAEGNDNSSAGSGTEHS